MSDAWYYRIVVEQFGPVSFEMLISHSRDGMISEGMESGADESMERLEELLAIK